MEEVLIPIRISFSKGTFRGWGRFKADYWVLLKHAPGCFCVSYDTRDGWIGERWDEWMNGWTHKKIDEGLLEN